MVTTLRPVLLATCAVPVIVMAPFLLAGCQQSALSQISRDTARMQMENPLKEQQLASLNAQNAALGNEKKQLLAELDNENLSLSELSEKLSNYQNQLANMEADNALQRKRYRSLQGRLQKYQNEIQSLKARPASSDAAKRKQIEALRARLREDLKAGED